MSENGPIYETSTIAELTNGIILNRFTKPHRLYEGYQSEAELERHLIADLQKQGYEFLSVRSTEQLYTNLKQQLEKLNNVTFADEEWTRFLVEYLDTPNDGMVEKTRKLQEDYIYDFVFDNGRLRNIKLIDKDNIHNNFLQVTHQVSQTGTHRNRYDVSILVNGLPLVHIELKKRGADLHEAFNQVHRYTKESFNTDHSLYKYVQIFVISNGTYTRYFANTTAQHKNHYEFTSEWADAKNDRIQDLEDFTATFFDKRTMLEVLTKYCVFDTNDTLLIMRPYQIAATERILWQIGSSYQNKKFGKVDAGGYVWHTTGSGKTLTSFKAAKLATELDYIDKVFFVVDRKDLDYQTMQEYQKFQRDSVNASANVKALKRNIEKDDNKIVVTTIQKLHNFLKQNKEHEIYNKHCVLIYDECHRSQFGDAQDHIKKAFKNYYQFGFTGTPILAENALGGKTTAGVFGRKLHSYIITDAIRDGKVLKFNVDYHNVTAMFKSAETESDEKELEKLEKEMLLHPDRISKIVARILESYDGKTRRNKQYNLPDRQLNGFNAMFAVQSVDAAKIYYEEFQKQQADVPEDRRLKIGAIYSFAANEGQHAAGDIPEENFEPTALDLSAKEFLDKVIADYNGYFRTNFSTDGNNFQNYYKDISLRVKNKEIDLLIVVGMFLTGFDAPTLNTLFVDKNLRYHGLIQAFSRTNRILNKVKPFGNIVCFRNLEQATKDAIKTFGDESDAAIIIEKSYQEYMDGFFDVEAKQEVAGYIGLCNEMVTKFPDPTNIVLESEKKEFVQLFGEMLKRENILKNFDDFKTYQSVISERQMQDMKSVYVDIREACKRGDYDGGIYGADQTIDFSDVEFHIDLLKTDEINLDYILKLILERAKEYDNLDVLTSEIRRVIRSSVGTRAKERLIVDFINMNDISELKNNTDILASFYKYAKEQRAIEIEGLTKKEQLKNGAKEFIEKSIDKGFVDSAGTELDGLLPPTSRRQGAREAKKQTVLEKIKKLVEIFMGV